MEKYQLLQENYFIWQSGGNGHFRQQHHLSRCKCTAIRTALTDLTQPRAYTCKHLLLVSWRGFLKSLIPQECKPELFTADIAASQRKTLLTSKHKLAPLYNSALGVASKRNCNVVSNLPNQEQSNAIPMS